MLDDAAHSWAQDAANLYEDMKAVEQEYALHCGLQQLFTQADGCAVPGHRTDSGYDFYLLAKDAPARRVSGLPAQLAAVLCGQADNFFSAYHDGQALCKSEVNVTVEDTAVQLHLRDCTLQSLADADDDLQGFLCAELQHAFAALTNDAKADFFHLQFWHENLYGVGREAPAPTLAVVFE